MTQILNEIFAIGGTTAWHGQFDAQRIVDQFVSKNLTISCLVAEIEMKL